MPVFLGIQAFLLMRGSDAVRLAVTNEQMKTAEANADKNGIPYFQLMKNAGQACFDRIEKILEGVKDKNIVVLAGRGNNGGDGIVITDLLLDAGANAILVFVSDLPKTDCARLCYSTYETGLNMCMYVHQKENVMKVLENSDAVIDAVFGTGFHGELDDTVSELFAFINGLSDPIKISVDIPSGINSDTGEIALNAFKPDYTITLAAVKKGLYSHPAFEYSGALILADIGIPLDCFKGCEAILSEDILKEFLPERKIVSHKGTYGRLLNISGSGRFPGAALLSTNAALKMGIGLCTLATPMRVINAIAAAIPEAIYLPLDHEFDGFINEKAVDSVKDELSDAKYSAILIGCGLGNNKSTYELTEFIIKNADCPIIIDADGLNAISVNINILTENKKGVIVTPHPAEFSRMTGLSVEEIQKNRLSLAKEFAAKYNAVTVLKGVNTVIASPTGEAFINTTGNPGLAKGGSGDVLSGVIASLVGQGADLFYGAASGVYLHGLAADKLAMEKPLYNILPRDIVNAL